ncbi:MAG: hypothetical protein NTY45_09635 [Elusimicrobia bacterium]|nr:hypothetical protein [Elusimicrobiota bacterium]
MSKCSNCNAPLSPSLRHCPACRADAGAPNVRECGSTEERLALEERFEVSKKSAFSRGCGTEFSDFILLTEKSSCVIVNMPAAQARNLVTDVKNIYVNYEKLVGSGLRLPALIPNDKKRSGMAGFFFGTYDDQIIYGFLGFPSSKLPSYGGIACQLKSISIRNRVSFLEENSYSFFNQHKDAILKSDFPKGYRAVWGNRHKLVMAKLGDRIQKGSTDTDHEILISVSGGMNREQDEFIEAHIFETFNVHAIEAMKDANTSKHDKGAKIDAKIALEQFAKIQTTP